MITYLEDLINQEKKKEEQEQDQIRIQQSLIELLSEWKKDFTNNPYFDKIDTYKRDGKNAYIYIFENGDTLHLFKDELTYGNTIYTLGLLWLNRFVEYANFTIDNQLSRPFGKAKNSGDNYLKSGKTEHPKWAIYYKLVVTFRTQKEHIETITSVGTKVIAENELEAMKGRIEQMQNTYGF